MKTFYRQLQGYMCYSPEAQAKKIKKFKTYGKSNKELNALIEKNIQNFFKNKKRRKTEKGLKHFQEMQISDNEDKEKSCLPVSNEKQARTNYFLHVLI